MNLSPNASPVVHQIMDRQNGIAVSAFTHPASWQAQSDIQWNMAHYSSPVRAFARAFDPASAAQVEFFPVEQLCWIEPNMGFYQPGQEAGGGAYCLKPMSAADTLIRWVLPRYRGNCQGLRVVGVTPVPPQQLLNAPPSPATQNANREGVCVRVEYMMQNHVIEEEFYGLQIMFPGIPSYGGAGMLMQYNWGFDRLFSFRAEKGQIEPLREQLWNTARSVRINPQWEQLYMHVLQQLKEQFDRNIQAGYDSIAAAGRLSQQISLNNQQWLNNQQHKREADYASDQRRRHQDAAASDYTRSDAFGDMIVGRETYNDPYYQYGSQHDGYHDYVWTDSQGNYKYSDDAGFDPNVGSTQNWVLMQKKQASG